jgi:choline dehydrogenase
MLSGVGPAAHLRKHGISAHVDAPEVGANLQDHPLTPLGFKAKRPFALGGQLRADRLLLAALRWQFTGKGLAATAPLTSIAFYKSREGLDRPDLETLFMPTSLAADVWFPGVRARHPDIMTTLNVALRPMSRGAVTLRSADPRDKPIIQFNFLAEPSDIEKLRFALRWTRELVTNTPISDFIGDEAFPGVSIDSDTALDAYIRKTVTTTQHPAGTCRMGADEAAVVDPQLRVRGVERLRVADASIMPLLISGHTNAPAIMIGEKCAIMIRGGAGDASLQSALAT